MVSFVKHSIEKVTEDKISLSGILLLPENPKGLIQINSATAVPKEFYLGIASYFAENNYASLVFDYRGICSSKPKDGLKRCKYELTDWPKKDMKAVLEYLNQNFQLPVYYVCHSVGGQLTGLVHGINQVKGMVTVATSSGFTGNMSFGSTLRSFCFFEIIRPIAHLVFGFTKVKSLGIMEDMPKNITNAWRKWCSEADYLFHPKSSKDIEGIEQYQNLKLPITVFTATDDYICTRANVDAFWQHVQSDKGIDFQWLVPSDFILKGIGHFDFLEKRIRRNFGL